MIEPVSKGLLFVGLVGSAVKISESIHGVGNELLFWSVTIGAIGVMWKAVVQPIWRFARKARRGVDIVLDFPDFVIKVERRLKRIEERQLPAETHERLVRELVADAPDAGAVPSAAGPSLPG